MMRPVVTWATAPDAMNATANTVRVVRTLQDNLMTLPPLSLPKIVRSRKTRIETGPRRELSAPRSPCHTGAQQVVSLAACGDFMAPTTPLIGHLIHLFAVLYLQIEEATRVRLEARTPGTIGNWQCKERDYLDSRRPSPASPPAAAQKASTGSSCLGAGRDFVVVDRSHQLVEQLAALCGIEIRLSARGPGPELIVEDTTRPRGEPSRARLATP